MKANEILEKLMTGDFYLKAVKTKRWIGVRLMQHRKHDKSVEQFTAYTNEFIPIKELLEGGWLRFVDDDGTIAVPSMQAILQDIFKSIEVPAGHTLFYDGQERKG